MKLNQTNGWLPYAVYRSTGCYSHLGKGFINHCGPTAITSAILTLRAKADAGDERTAKAEGTHERAGKVTDADRALFLEVARFGMRHLFYYNISFLHLIGGTSDLLTGLYLRLMLGKYVPGRVRVDPPKPLGAARMQRALQKGRFLYIQVLRHPKYRNHHFLCYGAEEAPAEEGGGIRFICGDGWSMRPVRLREEDFRLGSFRGISLEA